MLNLFLRLSFYQQSGGLEVAYICGARSQINVLCLSCLYYRENDRKQGETPNAGNCVRLYFFDSFQSPLNKLCRLKTKSMTGN